MNQENQSVQVASEGGLAATHKPQAIQPVLVGPSTADEFNALRTALIPVSCWRVDDLRFEFDSSFVTPGIRAELAELVRLRKKHPECPLLIFGHADPVGDDDYNKKLSGRRATAIYALLIVNSDPERAVRLWRQISATENWGAEQQKTMRANVPDGTPDSDLFKAYMQSLCPKGLMLTPKDFLAQGADAGGKGDYQGCSEFNPVLIFSQKDQQRFEQDQDKKERNTANAPNRRVMVLLFRKGSKVDPAKWPCPKAKEGIAGCKKRFWSDGEQRRSKRLPDKPREFEETKDTFACRFYDRIASKSPCELLIKLVTLSIRLIDDRGQPYANMAYRLEVKGGEFEGVLNGEFQETTNDDGVLKHRIPADSTSGKLTLIDKPGEGEAGGPSDLWTLDLEIVNDLGASDTIAGAQARLNNMGFFACEGISGYPDELTHRALQRFQTLYKVIDEAGRPETSGTLTSQTANKLKEIYGS